MKSTVISIAFLSTAAVMAEPTPAETPESKFRIRDAVTHDELARTLRKVEREDPMKKIKPAEGPDPTKVNQPGDLMSRSEVICFNGMAALVPKRAVLFVPAKLKERMQIQEGARLHGWAEFYARNRGWITTIEVTRVQAEGNEPLSEETLERMAKSANLVVATYKGGPISVLPLKQPEPEPESGIVETQTR